MNDQPIPARVGEPRPDTALQHILVLTHRSHHPSFPSDHAVTAGAVAAVVMAVSRVHAAARGRVEPVGG